MSIRGIARRSTPVGYATPTNAPVYVDSDDNILKYIPTGSGTTEIQLVDASTAQTLTNKTLTSPVITTPTLGAATATSLAVTALTNQFVLGTTPNLLTVSSPAPSGAVTLTLPTTADTLVGKATSDVLTNKTLTAPLYTELAEVVTSTNTPINAAESGSTFYLSAAGGFTSTLPAPALGMVFRFVVKTAPTGASYIITTASGSNLIYGMFEERAGGAGLAGAAQDTQNFVVNQAIIGDWAEYRSDGTNWYVHGMVNVIAGVTFAVT